MIGWPTLDEAGTSDRATGGARTEPQGIDPPTTTMAATGDGRAATNEAVVADGMIPGVDEAAVDLRWTGGAAATMPDEAIGEEVGATLATNRETWEEKEDEEIDGAPLTKAARMFEVERIGGVAAAAAEEDAAVPVAVVMVAVAIVVVAMAAVRTVGAVPTIETGIVVRTPATTCSDRRRTNSSSSSSNGSNNGVVPNDETKKSRKKISLPRLLISECGDLTSSKDKNLATTPTTTATITTKAVTTTTHRPEVEAAMEVIAEVVMVGEVVVGSVVDSVLAVKDLAVGEIPAGMDRSRLNLIPLRGLVAVTTPVEPTPRWRPRIRPIGTSTRLQLSRPTISVGVTVRATAGEAFPAVDEPPVVPFTALGCRTCWPPKLGSARRKAMMMAKDPTRALEAEMLRRRSKARNTSGLADAIGAISEVH